MTGSVIPPLNKLFRDPKDIKPKTLYLKPTGKRNPRKALIWKAGDGQKSTVIIMLEN